MGFGLTGMGALLTGGDIAGDTADEYGEDKVFGKKPKVADFIPVSLSDEQKKTAEENLKNADAITALLDKLMPGFSSILKQGLASSAELSAGILPEEVRAQLMRDSAQFAASTGGFAGTPFGTNRTLRDLGIGTLQGMQIGQNSAQQWAKLAETSYDPFIIKTMQQAGTTAANNAGEQAQQQYEFNVKAAPDPAAAGKYAINSAIGMQMLSFGMGAAGGAMGGAGGAAAAGGNMAGTTGTQGYGTYRYDPQTGSYVSDARGGGFAPVWGGT